MTTRSRLEVKEHIDARRYTLHAPRLRISEKSLSSTAPRHAFRCHCMLDRYEFPSIIHSDHLFK